MKKIILSIAILTSLLTINAYACNLNDIDNNDYQSEIRDLEEKSIINGYDDGSYKPNKSINRAEFLKIVLEAVHPDNLNGSNCFKDVKTEWFAKYVCYAKSQKIIQGYSDGYFKPNRTINYVEALKIIYLSNQDSGRGSVKSDVWYAPYLTDANSHKFMGEEKISNEHLMNRGEMAKLVSTYMHTKKWDIDKTDSSDSQSSNNDKNQDSNSNNSFEYSNTTSTTGSTGVDLDECHTMKIPTGATILSAGTDVLYNAVRNASAGDSLVLHGGIYKENHEIRVDKTNLTIMSYPGEWAVIDRSSDTMSDGDSGIWFYVGSDGSKLFCTEVKGGLYAVSTETKWDWGEADRSGASNLVIKNNKLHDSGHDTVRIKPNCDNVRIEQNEIYNSGKAYGSGSCNAEGIDDVNADNLIVRSNHIHDICSNGVYCKGGAINCLIENNLIENTGELGISLGFDTSPEYFDSSVNPEMYESIGGIARNNLIINTGLAGIGLYASKDSEVYNNTVVKANTSGQQAALYFGLSLQDWDDAGKRPANKNPKIHDNIIMQESDAPIISIRTMEDLGGLEALSGSADLHDNCYYQVNGDIKFEDGRDEIDYGGGWTEFWFGNLSEWQKHMNSDANSFVENPMLNSMYESQTDHCKNRGYQR